MSDFWQLTTSEVRIPMEVVGVEEENGQRGLVLRMADSGTSWVMMLTPGDGNGGGLLSPEMAALPEPGDTLWLSFRATPLNGPPVEGVTPLPFPG